MRMRLREFSLSIGLIVLSFLIFAKQPYSVVSDAGYQALSALQFAKHEVGHLNSVRLARPGDLSQTVECPLLLWAPFTAYAFFAGLKLGLATGTAARVLAALASLAGAAGWVAAGWVSGGTLLAGGRSLTFGRRGARRMSCASTAAAVRPSTTTAAGTTPLVMGLLRRPPMPASCGSGPSPASAWSKGWRPSPATGGRRRLRCDFGWLRR